MKTTLLLLTIFLGVCNFTHAQSAIVSGNFHQTVQANVPGELGGSQVSALLVNSSTFTAGYDSLDNLTNIEPFFIRSGNLEFDWTYNAGPVVIGHLSYATSGHINHTFANPDNPEQSTRLVYHFNLHSMPKIRPNETQLIVPVTFTVSGQIAVFTSSGPGVQPDGFELVNGQGSGTIIYRRRNAQFSQKVWRQTPQAALFLSSINLTFTAP